MGMPSQAWHFDVVTWTRSDLLDGHTGFTAHLQIIYSNLRQLPLAWASAVIVFGADCGRPPVNGRFTAMHYDENNHQVWEPLGAELTQNPQYNPNAQTCNVTDQISSWDGKPPRYIGFEVLGTGRVYQARLTLVYAIEDHAEQIAALQHRLARLENLIWGDGRGLPSLRTSQSGRHKSVA